MKGKITKFGNLEVLRRGNWIPQECHSDIEVQCGHSCPLFYETDPASSTTGSSQVVLNCSSARRYIEIVSDEREQGPEKGG